MNQAPGPRLSFARVQWPALIVGMLGLVACLVGYLVMGPRALESYLFAFLFWLEIAIGCQLLLALHYQVGGTWGAITLRLMEAATRTFPLLALLVIPILLGVHGLYPWAHPELVAADPKLQQKALYLNWPFFVARVIVYFASWIGVSHFLNKGSLEYDRTQDFAWVMKRRRFSAIALIVMALTLSFAWIDWVMALESHWFSTIFGMLVGLGMFLVGIGFVNVVLTSLASTEPFASLTSSRSFNDLGNLVLTFVMGWGYMAFSQLLVIWSGNLPDENIWYVHRVHDGWKYVAQLIFGAQFALPFWASLFKSVKRDPRRLRLLSLWVLAAHLVYVYWMVIPSFHAAFSLSWSDFAAVLGVGGVWLAAYAWQLSQRAIFAVPDPHLRKVLTVDLMEPS